MKPVFQEVIHEDRERGQVGDCMRAALASLLELPLHDVPHFYRDHYPDTAKAGKAYEAYLKAHGFMLMNLPCDLFLPQEWGSDVWHLIVGKLDGDQYLNDEYSHVCVGFNGRIIHDPLPGSPGLRGGPADWLAMYLVATNPAESMRQPEETTA